MAEVGRVEEEACRVVAEVEGDCGTRPNYGRNLGDRMTWLKWSQIEECQTDRAGAVTTRTFLAVRASCTKVFKGAATDDTSKGRVEVSRVILYSGKSSQF